MLHHSPVPAPPRIHWGFPSRLVELLRETLPYTRCHFSSYLRRSGLWTPHSYQPSSAWKVLLKPLPWRNLGLFLRSCFSTFKELLSKDSYGRWDRAVIQFVWFYICGNWFCSFFKLLVLFPTCLFVDRFHTFGFEVTLKSTDCFCSKRKKYLQFTALISGLLLMYENILPALKKLWNSLHGLLEHCRGFKSVFKY